MNRLLSLLVLFVSFFPVIAGAQSFSERRKADRERWYQEKEQVESLKESGTEEISSEMYYGLCVDALKECRFVLEADRVVFRNGRNVYVNSNTNFISLDGDEATVQVSPMNAYPGFNGVGGITLDGNASNIKIKEDKKNNIVFTMNVMGAAISAQVQILLFEGSDNAQVTITPNFSSNRIDLIGRIVPIEFSDVFKGSSI